MVAENAELSAFKCPFKASTGVAFRSVPLHDDTKTQSGADVKSEKSSHCEVLRAHLEWSYFWFFGSGSRERSEAHTIRALFLLK